MAEKKNKRRSSKRKAGGGKLAQMLQVLKLTCQHDRSNIFALAIAGGSPLAAGILVGVLVGPIADRGNPGPVFLWTIFGLMVGLLMFLLVLGRRAERMAYSQIEGQPGAVGSVLKSMRGMWRNSDTPVGVNPKTQDALYRAVGRCGVVLIVEGMRQRAQKILTEEQRRIKRVLPNVPIHIVNVNPQDSESVPLHLLSKTLRKLKRSLKSVEVRQIAGRLEALPRPPLGIPKGMDPLRMKRPSARSQR